MHQLSHTYQQDLLAGTREPDPLGLPLPRIGRCIGSDTEDVAPFLSCTPAWPGSATSGTCSRCPLLECRFLQAWYASSSLGSLDEGSSLKDASESARTAAAKFPVS